MRQADPKRTTEERLAALEAATAPQALAQALERAWDPRGGCPRIVDADGRTLDFQQTIQFLNATSVIDTTTDPQRIVVTPAGGGSGLAALFSDDGTTLDTERLKFVSESDDTKNILTIDTATFGALRLMQMLLSEDVAGSVSPYSGVLLTENGAGGQAGAQVLAAGAAGGGVTLYANELDGNTNSQVAVVSTASVINGVTVTAGGSQVQLRDETIGSGGAQLDVTVAGAAAGVRTIMDSDSRSNFVQAEAATNDPSDVRRVLRGPATFSPGALAAGASATGTASVVAGTSPVVLGGISGAAGVELCVWSWTAGPGANQITVSVTNTSLIASLTPVLTYVVLSQD